MSLLVIILTLFSTFCYAAFSSYGDESEEFKPVIVNIWKSKVLNLLGKITVTIVIIPWIILEFGIILITLLLTYHPHESKDDSSED